MEFPEDTLEYIRGSLLNEGREGRQLAANLLTPLARIKYAGAFDPLRRLALDDEAPIAVPAIRALSRYDYETDVVLKQLHSGDQLVVEAALWLAGYGGSDHYSKEIQGFLKEGTYLGFVGAAESAIEKIRISNSTSWYAEVTTIIAERKQDDELFDWALDIAVRRSATGAIESLRTRLKSEMARERLTQETLVEIARHYESGGAAKSGGTIEQVLWTIHRLGGDLTAEERAYMKALGGITAPHDRLEELGLLRDCPPR